MKITHKRIRACPHMIYQDINHLTISDPSYEKGLWCRYEGHDLQMKQMQIFMREEHILDGEFEFDTKEMVIKLSNDQDRKKISDQKEYEIGVDTAKFVMATEHGASCIDTMSDGYFGAVYENYYDGKLGNIVVNLVLPDEAIMSEDAFITAISEVFQILKIDMITLKDEDVEINLELTESQTGMRMETM